MADFQFQFSPTGPATFEAALRFRALSIFIDNPSGQTIIEPYTHTNIPPYTQGWVIALPFAVSVARLARGAPSTTTGNPTNIRYDSAAAAPVAGVPIGSATQAASWVDFNISSVVGGNTQTATSAAIGATTWTIELASMGAFCTGAANTLLLRLLFSASGWGALNNVEILAYFKGQVANTNCPPTVLGASIPIVATSDGTGTFVCQCIDLAGTVLGTATVAAFIALTSTNR